MSTQKSSDGKANVVTDATAKTSKPTKDGAPKSDALVEKDLDNVAGGRPMSRY